ncbi:hypothetical protein BASA81_010735 [Batrachochytrium salamandrivorans]|nr:hypothetical protein BASA81_010735 [Batrachochytrium salamandrivorans]
MSLAQRWSPKGVWSGAMFFQGLALSLMICMFWPQFGAWLIEKTELGDEFCWFTEGVWLTNYHWGELGCKPKHHFPTHDAVDLYCHNPQNSSFPTSQARDMCEIATRGRWLHAMGMVFGVLAAGFALWLQLASETLEAKQMQAKLSMASLGASIVCFLWLLVSIFYSPLFLDSHYASLSQGNIVSYRGLGCVFQSPFVNLDLFHSKPLKCLYPGPAVPFTTVIIVCLGMSLVPLGIIAFQQGALEPSKSYTTYSLHGAFMHRLSAYHRIEQYFVGFFVPLIAVGNGALLLSWFYHGMQFAVKVHVTIAGWEFMDTRLQVFCFDPVTILRYLWLGGTYLICLATAVWLDFFPFVKILVWIFLWFVPVDQTVRGRIFNWLEYLGRWTLVSLFCLCVIAIGFLFDETLELIAGLVVVRVQVVIGKGAGVDWFIVALVWTVALGSLFLDIHLWARIWEEERNKSQGMWLSNDRRRSSIIGRAFVRAARQFTRSVGTKKALCHQVFYPDSAQTLSSRSLAVGYRFSYKGQLLGSIAMVVLFGATLASFALPVFVYHRSGVIPNALVKQQVTEHNMFDLIRGTLLLGGTESLLWTFASVITLFVVAFPLLHAICLLMLWHTKLAVKRQKQLFRAVEFLDAWNSLDVFFLALCLTKFGSGTIGRSVVPVTVPGMTKVAQELFGSNAQIDVLEAEVREGFWVMLFALVMDKTMAYFMMQLCATALSLRQQEPDSATVGENEANDTVPSPIQREPLLLGSHLEDGEVVEGDDEPDELLLYSPADRYVGTSFTLEHIYAGIPLPLWRLMLAWGLLEEHTSSNQ